MVRLLNPYTLLNPQIHRQHQLVLVSTTILDQGCGIFVVPVSLDGRSYRHPLWTLQVRTQITFQEPKLLETPLPKESWSKSKGSCSIEGNSTASLHFTATSHMTGRTAMVGMLEPLRNEKLRISDVLPEKDLLPVK
jgi:hypothetical protein